MSKQNAWPWLKKGDLVDFIAPGFRCLDEELEGAVRFVESLGLHARVPKSLFGKSRLFSNQDNKRLSQLTEALSAKDSSAVWCLRGGYGSVRLLPSLAKLKPLKPKLFLGYSDITSLHLFLNQSWGWSTLHSPVLDRFGGGRAKKKEISEAKELLFGGKTFVEFKKLKPLNEAARSSKSVSGEVAGGNLAVLQSSLGTPFELRAKGKILFLEDIGERPHRMDRMLVHLSQTQALKGVRALVFGDLVLGNKEELKDVWGDVVHRFAKDLKVPVLRGLPVGHGPLQRILPLNTQARLDLNSKSLKVGVGGAIPR